MKIYIIGISLLSLLSISLQAQDLIVTIEGDSLNCKITKVKTDNIYFTFKYKEEIRSTLLALNQVKHYQYNFFQTAEVPADKVVAYDNYPHFRAAFNGGWSNRTAKMGDNIPSDFEQYIKDLKTGTHYGLDISYYFSEQLGLGFKYYNYKSFNSTDNIYLTAPDGTTVYGKMSDDISIDFIGPFFSTRFLNATKRNSLLLNVGLGYMGYTNDAVLITDFTLKSNTLGLCYDIAYDVSISENLAIGFQLSYLMGVLMSFEMSDGMRTETITLEKENYESLNRIDVSVGLRFSL